MSPAWVLIIWFASKGNYAYIPTVIDGYSSFETCSSAGDKFIEQANGPLRPRFACVTKK